MPNIENYKFTGNEKFNIKKFKTNDKGEFETREDALSQFVSNLNDINRLQQKLYADLPVAASNTY